MKTEETVLQFIKENNLINFGDTVICGLSGGADSCAMVSILHNLESTLGFSLIAAHLNHMLRGAEADRDEAFAKAFAESLNIPFYSEKVDVDSLAKTEGICIEDAGRKARYSFFERLKEKTGASKIATAHNKNDNAETVLMHIIRGSGVNGIRGILPERDGIIRPLLTLSRKEIESYCKEKAIGYITDSSNLHTDYTRNKLRLEVFPLLKEINPSVSDAILRLSLSAREISEAYVSEVANLPIIAKDGEAELALDYFKTPGFKAFPETFKMMLRLGNLSCYLTEKKIAALKNLVLGEKTVGSTDLGEGVFARLSYNKVIISKRPQEEKFEYTLSENKPLTLKGKKISLLSYPIDTGENIPVPESATITIRNRRPGDKIRLGGMTRRLQDVFVNKKIDRYVRDELIIVLADGSPLWVEKIGLCDKNETYSDNKKYIVIEKSEA